MTQTDIFGRKILFVVSWFHGLMTGQIKCFPVNT